MSAKKTKKSTAPKAKPVNVANWHVISDVEQLKSIANPLRMRLLAEFATEPRTTKQVAIRLNEKPTRLYHHVDALAENGLLKLVREVPKRGTTEKYYQAIARQFRVGADCFAQSETASGQLQTILELLDGAREGVLNSIQPVLSSPEAESASEDSAVLAVGGLVNPSKQELKEISKAIADAIKQYSAAQQDSGSRYRFAFVMYPDAS